jgi:hypothetical protein
MTEDEAFFSVFGPSSSVLPLKEQKDYETII